MPTLPPTFSLHRPGLLAAGAVLLAHAWVLQWAWSSPSSVWHAAPNATITQVLLPPPAVAAAPATVATPQPAPARRQRPRPTPPTEQAAPEPSAPAPSSDAWSAAPPDSTDAPTQPADDTLVSALNPAPSEVQAPDTAPPSAPTPIERPDTISMPSATLRLNYDVTGSVKGFRYSASATLLWQPSSDQRYTAHSEIRAFLMGARTQTSTGTLGPQGLSPTHFSDRARQARSITFDRTQGLVRLDGSGLSAPMPANVQDKLSVMLQMSAILAALPTPPQPGQTWTLPVAGSPSVENWVFRYEDSETLRLPAGVLSTWRFKRSAERANDPITTLWFAPALHHLPVRTRLEQNNGDVADQQLSALP